MKRAIVYLGMILISQNLFSQEGEDNQQLQAEEPKQELLGTSLFLDIRRFSTRMILIKEQTTSDSRFFIHLTDTTR